MSLGRPATHQKERRIVSLGGPFVFEPRIEPIGPGKCCSMKREHEYEAYILLKARRPLSEKIYVTKHRPERVRQRLNMFRSDPDRADSRFSQGGWPIAMTTSVASSV